MELRLQEDFNPAFIKTLIGTINTVLDADIWSILEKTHVYVISDKKDDVLLEIISKLEKKGMDEQARFFKDDRFKGKEIVVCISDDDDAGIEAMIMKVNVENGNGYKTVSVVHFIKRFMHILQERGATRVLTPLEERMKIEQVMHDVPRNFERSKIVRMERASGYSYFM